MVKISIHSLRDNKAIWLTVDHNNPGSITKLDNNRNKEMIITVYNKSNNRRW